VLARSARLIPLLLLASCQQWNSRPTMPEPLRPSRDLTAEGMLSAPEQQDDAGRNERLRFQETPGVPSQARVAAADYQLPTPELAGKPAQLNVEGLPLPAFINEVFGNILGLTFEIAPELQTKGDLVTLRVSQPQSPKELYGTAVRVLQNYGVTAVWDGSMVRFAFSKNAQAGEPPLLVSGRTLPTTPVSHRPVFQLVTLQNVRNTSVRGWLAQLYKGQDIEINEDPDRNAIILQGAPAMVEQALQAVAFLDQPTMRGRYSLRIEPLYQNPKDLGDALLTVLQSEGYGANDKPPGGSVLVVPMEKINAILVFAADAKLLEHVRHWAETLDQPGQTGQQGGFFYYAVQNATADDLAKAVGGLMGGGVAGSSGSGAMQASDPLGGAATTTPTRPATRTSGSTGGSGGMASATVKGSNSRLQADASRNAILFYGPADEWARMLPILREMDVAAKQVLVEVTVAEITLTDDDQFGIEWIVNGGLGKYGTNFGTLGGLGVGGSSSEGGLTGGFSFTLSTAGQTRMVLNALASNQRVNVLSTPRVMVKSGAEASIEVGTEVPIVTSQSTASDLGTSGSIMQNIQYRKTGVILTVTPVVHSDRRVDLKVSQEISSASPNKTSGVDSPTILNRRVNTELALRAGGSVLLGGLISEDATNEDRGIPGLKDLPGLGLLFSSQSRSRTRTELIVLLVPYILDGAEDAEAITQEFQQRLSWSRQEEPVRIEAAEPAR